eukprot:gene21906-28361_t
MRYSRTVSGPMYASSTAVVSMETLKLITCLLVIIFQSKQLSELPTTNPSINPSNNQLPSNLSTYQSINGITGLWFVLREEILFKPIEMLNHLDAATFQVGYQVKILTTAVFSVLMLGKRLTILQWFSLIILTIGVSMAQLSAQNLSSSQNTTLGFVAVLLASITSGFSGVYFEKLLKSSTTSLWMRNIQMGSSSVVLGLLTVYVNPKDREIVITNGFFYGYTWIVITVIALQAIGGLVVAVVVKYADNILKGFAASFSI